MAFWSGETLLQKLPNLIERFNPEKIDCSTYTLTVGPEAYVTPDHRDKNVSQHTVIPLGTGAEDDQKCRFVIPPGQFGFLLTEETIKVPEDAMAFISMKSGIKFKGLINASGFHVDPGYHGRLIFSVFNAGPQPIHIKRKDDLFLIWYADLTNIPATNEKNSAYQYHKTYSNGKRDNEYIPTKLVNGISGEIQSAHGLSEKIRSLDSEMRVQRWIVGTTFALLLIIAGNSIREAFFSSKPNSNIEVVKSNQPVPKRDSMQKLKTPPTQTQKKSK